MPRASLSWSRHRRSTPSLVPACHPAPALWVARPQQASQVKYSTKAVILAPLLLLVGVIVAARLLTQSIDDIDASQQRESDLLRRTGAARAKMPTTWREC